MKQFVLKDGPDRDGLIRLGADDYRYLVRVRRLAPGECFPALLPGGEKVLVRVLSVGGHVLSGEIVHGESPRPARPDLPSLILFQSLPKGEKMDLIVRQAAEGGLGEIVPFVSEFSAIKAAGGGGQKFLRWQRIIKEARQQSGSETETEIREPLSIDGLFARWEKMKTRGPGVIGLLFHHLPLENESLHGYLGRSLRAGEPETVVLAVGPEGGFSPAEAERFTAAGFKPFTIGNTVLRTETAALYAQAAVRLLLLEKDSWETK